MTVMHARIKYASIMIVVIALAAVTFVWPIRSKVISTNRRLADLQNELDQSDTTLERIENAQQKLEAVKQRLATEMKPMPARADLPGLIKDITRNVADLPLQGSNVNRSQQCLPLQPRQTSSQAFLRCRGCREGTLRAVVGVVGSR